MKIYETMKTILYSIVCIFLVSVFSIVFILVWLFTLPLKNNKQIITYLTVIYCKIIIKTSLSWKVNIHGLEKIEKDKAYVIMPNHQSMLDIPVIAGMGINSLWIAKKEVLYIPLVNFILMIRRDLLIKRGSLSDSKKMIKACRAALRNNISVTVFPEGTRTKTGKIEEFKEGAFVVAKLGHADILPIVIDGSYDTTHPPVGWGLKFPSVINVYILDPIPFDSFQDEQVKDLNKRVHNMMVSYHKTLRPELYN